MEDAWKFTLALCLVFLTCFNGPCAQAASVRSSKGEGPLRVRINQVECLAPVNSGVNVTRTGRTRSTQGDENLVALFAGQMQFSVDLFRTLFNASRSEGTNSKNAADNLFVSPMSIYSALLLAYFGAHNRTEDQLGRVLGFKDVDSKVGAVQAYKLVKFTRQLMTVAGLAKYDFDIANRLYFDQEENIRPCMNDIFNDEIESMDFFSQPEESRVRINQWVQNVTRNKIRDFLSRGAINANTRMALVNAAYFKGLWASQFKTANTRPSSFRTNGNKDPVTVNMMFQKGRFRQTASEELLANVLEMPFLGDDVSFFVILPATENGLDETVNRMNLDNLREILQSRAFPVSLEVGLPKFRMEQTVELKQVLLKMGVRELFDPNVADLSGFTGNQGLSVDSVTHKAVIEVNEEGSEAAAATALVDLRMARPLNGNKFICDRPFIYLIYDNLSDSILFMGVFKNPK